VGCSSPATPACAPAADARIGFAVTKSVSTSLFAVLVLNLFHHQDSRLIRHDRPPSPIQKTRSALHARGHNAVRIEVAALESYGPQQCSSTFSLAVAPGEIFHHHGPERPEERAPCARSRPRSAHRGTVTINGLNALRSAHARPLRLALVFQAARSSTRSTFTKTWRSTRWERRIHSKPEIRELVMRRAANSFHRRRRPQAPLRALRWHEETGGDRPGARHGAAAHPLRHEPTSELNPVMGATIAEIIGH